MSHHQRIRYLQASDHVKLAWAETGTGPVLVKASNWLSHLEYDWESPIWNHWLRFFADRFRFVRYAQVRTSTLVLHGRNDEVVPIAEGV